MHSLRALQAVFWSTVTGREPAREWLKDLPKEDRHAIGDDLRTAQFGWPVGMPLCKPLGDGLSEIRSNLPQKRIARLFVTLYEGVLVVLHGIIKKSQKLPKADLELARRRKKELEQKGLQHESKDTKKPPSRVQR